MTNDTAISILQFYGNSDDELMILQNRIFEAVSTCKESDELKMLERKEKKLQKFKSIVYVKIDALPYYEKTIIIYRCIYKQKWNVIARKINYSRAQTINIFNKAILHLAEKFEGNSCIVEYWENKEKD